MELGITHECSAEGQVVEAMSASWRPSMWSCDDPWRYVQEALHRCDHRRLRHRIRREGKCEPELSAQDADKGIRDAGCIPPVTVGRRPKTEGCGIEATGGTTTVGSSKHHRCATNMRRPCHRRLPAMGPMPHMMHPSKGRWSQITRARIELRPVAVPAIVFTEPEIIEVGLAPARRRWGRNTDSRSCGKFHLVRMAEH